MGNRAASGQAYIPEGEEPHSLQTGQKLTRAQAKVTGLGGNTLCPGFGEEIQEQCAECSSGVPAGSKLSGYRLQTSWEPTEG